MSSAAATETAQETKRKTRTRRLRRKNVVKVDGIDEAARRKQQEEAIESINRIINRSNDEDERTNGNNSNKNKRQLVSAGSISKINVSQMNNEHAIMELGISNMHEQHNVDTFLDEEEAEALYLMTHILQPRNRNSYSFSMSSTPVSLDQMNRILPALMIY